MTDTSLLHKLLGSPANKIPFFYKNKNINVNFTVDKARRSTKSVELIGSQWDLCTDLLEIKFGEPQSQWDWSAGGHGCLCGSLQIWQSMQYINISVCKWCTDQQLKILIKSVKHIQNNLFQKEIYKYQSCSPVPGLYYQQTVFHLHLLCYSEVWTTDQFNLLLLLSVWEENSCTHYWHMNN